MMRTAERNFWLDVAIFASFLITTVTGVVLWRVAPHHVAQALVEVERGVWIAAHVGAGLMGLAGVVVHIVWHRDWLKALRRRPLNALPAKVRANRIVDRILWICYLAAQGFGVATWALRIAEPGGGVSLPERLHVVFGVAYAVLTLAHLGLHREWIAATARRCAQAGWVRAKGLQSWRRMAP